MGKKSRKNRRAQKTKNAAFNQAGGASFGSKRQSLFNFYNFGERTNVKNPIKEYSWAYISINKISNSVSSIPFGVYNKKTLERDENSEWNQLFENPNPLFPTHTMFWKYVTAVYKNFGSVFLIPRDRTLTEKFEITSERTVPEAIEIVTPGLIEKWEDQAGILRGWKYERPQRGIEYYGLDEIVRIWDINPVDVTAYTSFLSPMEDTVNSDINAQKYNANFFENGAQIPGYLKATGEGASELTEDESRRIRANFDALTKGVNNAHSVPLFNDIEYFPTGANQKDMDFSTLRTFNREEVLAAFGVPKTKVGLTDKVDRAVAKVFNRQYFEDTIDPILKLFQESITNVFMKFSSVCFKFDISDVDYLKEDLETKLKNAIELKNLGYPVNEINRKLELGMDEINEPWANEAVNVSGQANEASEQSGAEEDETDGSGSGEEKSAAGIREKSGYFGKTDKQVIDLYHSEVLDNKRLVSSFDKKVKAYINKLEKAQLEELKKLEDSKSLTKAVADDYLFNLKEWDEEMRKYTDKSIERAFDLSVDFLEKEVEAFRFFEPEVDKSLLNAVKRKQVRITVVNNTIRSAAKKVITDGIKENLSIAEMTVNMRKVFTNARARSLTIVRTEVAQSAGKARHIGLQKERLFKKWITANDEQVRKTHIAYGKTGVKELNFDYSGGNNLRHPSDINCTDVSEIINCRCLERAARPT